MTKAVLDGADSKMAKAVEALQKDLATLRTGRASAKLVDYIRVDYYGTPTPIGQMASISVPDPRMITIQPWDKTMLPAIEKAILKSELGLNPSTEGGLIRLKIPELTEERRRDLVRIVRKKVEEGRVAVRNVRRAALEKLREMQKAKEISEDDQKRAEKQLQELTDKYIARVDEVGKEKETEVMES